MCIRQCCVLWFFLKPVNRFDSLSCMNLSIWLQMIPAVKDIYGPTKPCKKFECVGHYHYARLRILEKKKKETRKDWDEEEVTNTKIDTKKIYFGIALLFNVRNLAAMNSACMTSIYVSGYRNNCPKPTNTCRQSQKDKQGKTNYCKLNGDLPIVIRKAILPIYQSLCKSEMFQKSLHSKNPKR